MSSFRRPFTALHEAQGSYVSGEWVPGTRLTSIITASVQPVHKGDQDLEVLPEGRHWKDVVKVYTSARLSVATDGEGIQPSIVVFDGYGYEVVSIEKYQSGVISHYKYLGTKILKFTSTEDWLSGILRREP